MKWVDWVLGLPFRLMGVIVEWSMRHFLEGGKK